jgi:hypothetical protein
MFPIAESATNLYGGTFELTRPEEQPAVAATTADRTDAVEGPAPAPEVEFVSPPTSILSICAEAP